MKPHSLDKHKHSIESAKGRDKRFRRGKRGGPADMMLEIQKIREEVLGEPRPGKLEIEPFDFHGGYRGDGDGDCDDDAAESSEDGGCL